MINFNQRKNKMINKIKSEYKNAIAKKLHEEAWNELGSDNMDFDSFRFSATLIEAGEYKALYKIMIEMDSIPREYIASLLPQNRKDDFKKEFIK
jgi:hypothetical protein